MSAIQRTKRQDDSARDPRHGLCAYSVDTLSCPLPGVYSAPGARSPWYCWLHESNRPQGPGAREDLAGIIEHQAELRRGHHGASTIEQQGVATIRAHPEWYRQAGETSAAYRARMVGTLRRHLGRATKPLPYDPDARLAADEAAEERAAIVEAGA